VSLRQSRNPHDQSVSNESLERFSFAEREVRTRARAILTSRFSRIGLFERKHESAGFNGKQFCQPKGLDMRFFCGQQSCRSHGWGMVWPETLNKRLTRLFVTIYADHSAE
jgi:hypothetical protein